jgi:hypothetical protein
VVADDVSLPLFLSLLSFCPLSLHSARVCSLNGVCWRGDMHHGLCLCAASPFRRLGAPVMPLGQMAARVRTSCALMCTGSSACDAHSRKNVQALTPAERAHACILPCTRLWVWCTRASVPPQAPSRCRWQASARCRDGPPLVRSTNMQANILKSRLLVDFE